MPHHPHKRKNYEWWILGLIMLVAIVFRFTDIKTVPPGLYPDEAMNGNNALEAIRTGDYKVYYPDNNGREGLFMNIQAQSIKLFGNEPWALRIVSAIFGTLTVLGLFLLTRKLFNWEIATFASFLLAVSFWHTLFSRIGFRAIMAPCFLVWGLYYFWKAKTSTKFFDFALSGLFLGLGMYSYIAYRVTPLIVLIALGAYWHSLKIDFSHEKYTHTRNRLMRGFALLMLVAIIVSVPLAWYYLVHPADFLGRTSQVSIFSDGNPLQSLIINTGKTLGMFNITGDWNWRHNIAGKPLLFWPVGLLFLLGLCRGIVKLWRHKKSHGHFPTVQIMLLSWLALGLLPVIFSSEGLPHALRAILVVPVVMIFAGEGLWWVYDFCRKWYALHDTHEIIVHEHHGRESHVIATLTIAIFLFAVTVSEYQNYFVHWAQNPNVASHFDAESVALGRILNNLPKEQLKYVVINAAGVDVRGIPMPAQTVMFITDTWLPEQQKAKNIYYITESQYERGHYPKKAQFFPLRP